MINPSIHHQVLLYIYHFLMFPMHRAALNDHYQFFSFTSIKLLLRITMHKYRKVLENILHWQVFDHAWHVQQNSIYFQQEHCF